VLNKKWLKLSKNIAVFVNCFWVSISIFLSPFYSKIKFSIFLMESWQCFVSPFYSKIKFSIFLMESWQCFVGILARAQIFFSTCLTSYIDTGVARNFDWGGLEEISKWKKNLWRYFSDVFGDIITMTSLKWRHNWFLKFDFVIISLTKQNFATSRNFRS